MIYVLSGGGKPFAVIGATYPSGSTCTCTNGSKKLTAKDTSGQALFVIPSTGTWTVTCTNGTDTASEAVSITAEGQTKTVTLLYELVLWNNGSVNEDVTGGWDGNQASASLGDDYEKYLNNGSIGYYGTASVTKNKVDVTKYNTLIFNVVSFTSAGPVATLGISNRTSSPAGDAIATVTATKSQTYPTELSVDVSAVSGEYYVFIYADGYFADTGGALTCGITVNNVKLV